MRIKAAVLRAADAPYRIEDVELAEPGPGEVRVRIAGTGLCHTDLLPRMPGGLAAPPIVAGHEGAGVVEEVGADVTEVVEGDHVVLSYDSCRVCANCLAGQRAYCASFFPRNLAGADSSGGPGPMRDADGEPIAARWFCQSSFATHALVRSRNTVKVDPELPLELLGPLGCGVQTGAGSVLNSLGVAAGTSFVVYGAGGVGLSAVMAARVAGATTIIAVDVNPARLKLATELGATHAFDGSAEDLPFQILEATVDGAQYALDTTGLPAVITTAVNTLRPTGTLGLAGVQQGPLSLDPSALAVGRNIRGILEGDALPQLFIPRLIDLWRQDRFPFDKLITTFPLDEINAAERASTAGEAVKPVLIPAP